jgi:hypothetical protein
MKVSYLISLLANAFGLAAIVLLLIDPTLPLWPIVVLLMAAVACVYVWRFLRPRK